MFNVSVKGNVRCNGIAQAPRGGMVRRTAHITAMPPSGGNSVSDTKLKFYERVEAYLSVDKARSDGSSDGDDPYQFSESDTVVSLSRKTDAAKPGVVNGAVCKSEVMSKVASQIKNKVKLEPNVDVKDTKNSIIACKWDQTDRPSGKPVPGVLRVRRHARGTHHEGSVQRIPEPEPGPVYQRHWFNRELELLTGINGGREARLELVRTELRRHLRQMRKGRTDEKLTGSAKELMMEAKRQQRLAGRLRAQRNEAPPPRPCASCKRPALPCTTHCSLHIMSSSDQVLFDYCTAKFADNTQCSVPVIDVAHELPLCAEHARKRDNYNKMCAEVRPKKQRRKIKPSAMIRPQRRSKKRKRPSQSSTNNVVVQPDAPVQQVTEIAPIPDDLELVTVEHALVTQASRLLEETDFTTVLNQIPADEFNDLFSDRNGEYEPSMEETEELERALRAVDNDVKSLEKLSQTHGLLDQLLADDTLTLPTDLPDVVFHTAYVTPTPQ